MGDSAKYKVIKNATLKVSMSERGKIKKDIETERPYKYTKKDVGMGQLTRMIMENQLRRRQITLNL